MTSSDLGTANDGSGGDNCEGRGDASLFSRFLPFAHSSINWMNVGVSGRMENVVSQILRRRSSTIKTSGRVALPQLGVNWICVRNSRIFLDLQSDFAMQPRANHRKGNQVRPGEDEIGCQLSAIAATPGSRSSCNCFAAVCALHCVRCVAIDRISNFWMRRQSFRLEDWGAPCVSAIARPIAAREPAQGFAIGSIDYSARSPARWRSREFPR